MTNIRQRDTEEDNNDNIERSIFMFETEFILNDKLLTKNIEVFKNSLKSLDVNTPVDNLINKMRSSSNWFEEFDEPTLKKIIVSLSKIDGSVDIKISGWEAVHFKYDNAMKKLFFIHAANAMEYKPNARIIVNALMAVETVENKNNKCVLNFTKEEIRDSVIDLVGGMHYYRLRQRINVISNMQDFYGKEISVTNSWRKTLTINVLETIIGKDVGSNDLIDMNDLIKLAQIMHNMQESIVPLLIFNGVKLSKAEDVDEIRYLRKRDLDGNMLTVKGREGKRDRVIDLDVSIARLLKEASLQEYVIKEKKGSPAILSLKDTEYILRPVTPARKKKDGEEDILSFRGAWGRLLLCREQMEALAPEFSFSAKKIEQSGKIHFINRYVEECGMELYDAIRETLKRFGDWRYLETGSEISYPPNAQMVNRLKRLWSAYN